MKTLAIHHYFDQISPSLKKYALLLTRDSARAADLYQETSLKAFSSPACFTNIPQMKAWLQRIMKNTFINDYRKNQSRTKHLPIYRRLQERQHSHTVYNDAEQSIALAELHSLIDEMNPMHQSAFLLMLSGYKYHEIADHLNLPIGTIKSRIFQARCFLKKRIAGLQN